DKQCAHLIAVACSDAPDGHGHWTLRLLTDKAVELGFAESLSHEAVRDVLKKTSLSRGKRSNGASRK
ncbi:MAG TPA: IS630 family transposase, partial [Noviherbaspirillum sp.]